MTAFLAHASEVVSRLVASPALAGGRVRMGRSLSMPSNVDTAIEVAIESSDGRHIDLAATTTQWDTRIAIDVRARATPGQDAITAVDSLLGDVFGRLSGPPPADVMSWQMDPSIRWDIDEANETIVTARLGLRVTHLTGGSSLTPVS